MNRRAIFFRPIGLALIPKLVAHTPSLRSTSPQDLQGVSQSSAGQSGVACEVMSWTGQVLCRHSPDVPIARRSAIQPQVIVVSAETCRICWKPLFSTIAGTRFPFSTTAGTDTFSVFVLEDGFPEVPAIDGQGSCGNEPECYSSVLWKRVTRLRRPIDSVMIQR